ncbi:hypothetical protein EMPG_12804 [Blastomyces silverae]|uniref:Uncharacterized protein n=1 Tax=Blastomyces silverae TaxID=2060906 RepID=A0A0H1BLQ9_9EURO|nr:hypothetical protein EMPG_12804 [Blastomyces silverae]
MALTTASSGYPDHLGLCCESIVQDPRRLTTLSKTLELLAPLSPTTALATRFPAMRGGILLNLTLQSTRMMG